MRGMLDAKEDEWGSILDRKSQISIYKLLEWKMKNSELSYHGLHKMLSFIFREIDIYKNTLLNLIGMSNSGKIVLKKEKVEFSELIDETIDLFYFSAKSKGVEIKLDANEYVSTFIDKSLFRRALVNVIDNAIKYSYSTTEASHQRFIRVISRRHNISNDWIVLLSSYGAGILPGEQLKIFEKGFRGELAKKYHNRGSGIGLYETKKIIEGHNGKIDVYSSLKPGNVYITSTKIVFPVCKNFRRSGERTK